MEFFDEKAAMRRVQSYGDISKMACAALISALSIVTVFSYLIFTQVR